MSGWPRRRTVRGLVEVLVMQTAAGVGGIDGASGRGDCRNPGRLQAGVESPMMATTSRVSLA